MKILITTDLYTTATNGVVTSIKNLCGELQKKGHDVHILTLSDGLNSYKESNVTYIRSIPLGAIYPDVRMAASYRHKLIKELVDWKPDIIHSQCEFFSLQFALYISKKTSAPIVHTYHTLYEQYATYLVPSKRLGRHIVRYVTRSRLKYADSVIAPTSKVKDTLLSYGINNTISIIPSGISLEQHQKRITPEERKEKRHALGIDDSSLVLINLGRLGTEKNLEELLELFAKAITKNKKLVFLIVGDGPAKKPLEKLAEGLGISEYVIFTGMVDPADVQNYYQLGDIFVSASTSETQGLTYVEAAANGLPLLCRQDLCLKDVLIPGENGYEFTNEFEFLNNIDNILKNPEWLISAAAYSEKIAAGFSKSAFGDAVEAVYKEVLQ